jgi:hypothetical protein
MIKCLTKIVSNSQVQWLTPLIPATREAEIGRIMVPGQPEKKVSETPSQPTGQVHCHTLVIPDSWEAKIGILRFEASLDKNARCY